MLNSHFFLLINNIQSKSEKNINSEKEIFQKCLLTVLGFLTIPSLFPPSVDIFSK